jgi:phage anti-repressor protein
MKNSQARPQLHAGNSFSLAAIRRWIDPTIAETEWIGRMLHTVWGFARYDEVAYLQFREDGNVAVSPRLAWLLGTLDGSFEAAMAASIIYTLGDFPPEQGDADTLLEPLRELFPAPNKPIQARALHKFLKVEEPYKDWLAACAKQFPGAKFDSSAKAILTEYQARYITMMDPSDRGLQFRLHCMEAEVSFRVLGLNVRSAVL